MAVGGRDDPMEGIGFDRGPAGAEQFLRGGFIESGERHLDDPAAEHVGAFVEARMDPRRDEDLRGDGVLHEGPQQPIGRGTRVQVVDRDDASGQVGPQDGDRLDRIVRGPGDHRLQPPTALPREEVGEGTQEAVGIVMGIHASGEGRAALAFEDAGDERRLADPRDADDDRDRVGRCVQPGPQCGLFVRPTEERSARRRGLRSFRPRDLDHVRGEDMLDRVGFTKAAASQGLDGLGAGDLAEAARLVELHRAGPRVIPHLAGDLLA